MRVTHFYINEPMLLDNKRFYFFLLVLCLYFGIVFVGADFYKTPFKDYKDFMVLIMQWGIVLFASFGLLLALVSNKYLFAVAFPLLAVVASALAYFRFTLNMTVNANIVEAALDNDMRTSTDLISVAFIFFVVLNFLISLIFVYYRWTKICLSHSVIYLFAGIVIIFSTTRFFGSIKGAIQNRIPYVLYYSFRDYEDDKKNIRTNRPDFGGNVSCAEDSLIVVYVQGEALRADHLHLNGYQRQTTPLLENAHAISLKQIYSPYTYTDRSVPYILTNADSLHPDFAYQNRSFISLFNGCHFHTYWIAGQNPATAFVYFAKEADSLIYTAAGKTVYNFEPYSWLDGEALEPLQKIVSNGYAKKLVVVHTIGSHWWYKTHYTKAFEKFSPVIESRIVSSNTKEEMINTYDNTILYTDYFLNNIIQLLKNKKAILIYLSDHGESLGEDGKWLHAEDALPEHRPACIVWLSDKYKKEDPLAENILQQNAPEYFNTSFLFPSILDAAHIQTPVLDTSASIFRLH